MQSPETLFTLEREREERISYVVTVLQKMVKGVLARRYFKQLMACWRYVRGRDQREHLRST